MRKKLIAALLIMAFSLSGCGSSGVSQEEYDKVVAERDQLQKKYDDLLEDYAAARAEQTIQNIENEVREEMGSPSEPEAAALEDSEEGEPFFSYSGTGDDSVSCSEIEIVSYAKIVYEGTGHFSVKGHYGDSYDLLVNTTNQYNGTTLIHPDREYTFEVSARGDWTIDLYKMGTSSTDTFSGVSDCVTPVFLRTSDVYEVSTSGGGHFSIKGCDNSGYDLLVNTTDENYSGKIMFKSKDSYAFFEIVAEREWQISPSE